MAKEQITGAEALMRSLEYQGVKTLFGYPGGSIMPTFDALYHHRDTLNHILVRHEQGAAHAAQGFARVSGEVGVCLVTSGPGATNTITGIADAMIDSTPIVVIAGQVGASFLGTDAFQEVDLVGITQPISKWSYQIRRAEDVAWAVARAFYIARSGRPGPVVLDFAKNAQVEMVDYEPMPSIRRERRGYLGTYRRRFQQQGIERVVEQRRMEDKRGLTVCASRLERREPAPLDTFIYV